MPAKSKAQQRFMGMVHAVQKGTMTAPSKKIEEAARSMSKEDATDFAKTKRKGLPEKVSSAQITKLANFITNCHLLAKSGMLGGGNVGGGLIGGGTPTPITTPSPIAAKSLSAGPISKPVTTAPAAAGGNKTRSAAKPKGDSKVE